MCSILITVSGRGCWQSNSGYCSSLP